MEQPITLTIPKGKAKEFMFEKLVKLQDQLTLEVNGELKTLRVKDWIREYHYPFGEFIDRNCIFLTVAGQEKLFGKFHF